MLTAHDVADFFLSPVAEEEGEQITNLKLQKLLYYAQGYSLAILERPIFPEKIENWTHGPVVSNVYVTYRQHGASPLPASHLELDKYSQEELYILNRVRNEKGKYTAWALRNKTHQEKPWLETKNGDTISTQMIADYFKKILAQPDFNYDLDRMRKAVEGDFIVTPNFDNETSLLEWLNKN